MLRTTFPERAGNLIDEIAARPLAVGLQDVSPFRTGAADAFAANPRLEAILLGKGIQPVRTWCRLKPEP